MPKLKPGESQSDYMSRCVPEVKGEGASQEQAVGKCLGMYRHYSGSESIIEKIDKILNEAKGSYLDNQKIPKEGQKVWITVGLGMGEVIEGKVVRVTNIDRKGLANTYLDVETSKGIQHVNVMSVFDHKPKKVMRQDAYGKVAVWEATVVGEVGKRIATETQCPKGQIWCPKCHACIDIRENPGMGIPRPPCPHVSNKSGEGMFTWEE